MKMSDDELLKFDGFDDLEKGFKEIKDKNLPDIDYDLS